MNMVGNGADNTHLLTSASLLSTPPPPLPPNAGQLDYNSQWCWPRAIPPPRGGGGLRSNIGVPNQMQMPPPSTPPPSTGRRRRGNGGNMFMRGFYPGPGPGPRNFVPPPQQPHLYPNQGQDHFQHFSRKPRPQWVPRNVRLPHFSPNHPNPNFLPFQQPPPWPNAPQSTSHHQEEGSSDEPSPKKKKRTTNGTSRPWNREAAEKALAMELEFQKTAGANAIVVRFPDPELSKEIVQNFHPAIDNVHFQAPCGGRYCFVTLKDDANVEKVMSEINKMKFGVGYLQTERKVQKTEENIEPESIDPFTLYVGNLPTNISTLEVKEKFPTASRIDIGYAQKMKYTRYAFVRYSTSEAALEAFKNSINSIIASRSIILRFRRHKGPVGPPGEKPAPSIIEAKPGEKLTVGAKLKAKKEKAKAEKVAREKEKTKTVKIKKEKTSDNSSDEEVEMENDGTDSDDDEEEDEDEDDDDDDDHDDPDDDDEEEEEDEDEEDVVDDDDDLDTNMPDDEEGWDDDDDEDAYKDFDFFGKM